MTILYSLLGHAIEAKASTVVIEDVGGDFRVKIGDSYLPQRPAPEGLFDGIRYWVCELSGLEMCDRIQQGRFVVHDTSNAPIGAPFGCKCDVSVEARIEPHKILLDVSEISAD